MLLEPKPAIESLFAVVLRSSYLKHEMEEVIECIEYTIKVAICYEIEAIQIQMEEILG